MIEPNIFIFFTFHVCRTYNNSYIDVNFYNILDLKSGPFCLLVFAAKLLHPRKLKSGTVQEKSAKS